MNKLYLALIVMSCMLIQASPTHSVSTDSDMKSLIINGSNFWFMIKEPDGWTEEINDANARQLNAYFVPNGQTWNNASSVIYIRVLDKQGLTVEQHLEADTEDFRKKGSVQFKKFDVKDIRYRYATSLYLIGSSTV